MVTQNKGAKAISKLTVEKVGTLLGAYNDFKPRTANIEVAIKAIDEEKDDHIYANSVTTPPSEMLKNRQQSDKVANIAISLADSEWDRKTQDYREELRAISNATEQVDTAMKGLTARQRYVIRERYFKLLPSIWTVISLNASDRFQDCSEKTLRRDEKKAIKIMSQWICLPEKTYNLAIGQKERQSH